MFRFMLCGIVVMTACCFGMEKGGPENQKVIAAWTCILCSNPQCSGFLPGQMPCRRVGACRLMPPYDIDIEYKWSQILYTPKPLAPYQL